VRLDGALASAAVLVTLCPAIAGADLTDKFAPELSMRVRAQAEWFDSKASRYRARLRARAGGLLDIGHGFQIGARLTTGSDDPTSSQYTLGNEFGREPLKLDQLFVRAKPVDWLTLWLGKVPAVFHNRRVIWDRDVRPEGATQAMKLGCPEGIELDVTLGEYMFMEVRDSVKDPVMLVGQSGMAIKRGPVDARLDLGIYDYHNLAGQVLTFAHGANAVDGDGHLLGDYSLVDMLFEHTVKSLVTGYVELVRNVRQDTAQNAFAVGLEIETKQLEAGYEFRRVEREAILDALGETAWYEPRTEYSGHKVGASHTFGDSGWQLKCSFAWMHSLVSPRAAHYDLSVDAQWDF